MDVNIGKKFYVTDPDDPSMGSIYIDLNGVDTDDVYEGDILYECTITRVLEVSKPKIQFSEVKYKAPVKKAIIQKKK